MSGKRGGKSNRSTKPVTMSNGLEKAVVAKIKEITAPSEEVKYIAKQWSERDVQANVNTTAGADLYKLIPEVSQGTDASTRLGNTINPKSIRNHFVVYFPAETQNTANVYVRFLCISSREVKDYNAATALSGSNLFLDGVGGSQDIIGQTYADNIKSNQFLPVNRKSWIVHHDKVVHLARGFGNTSNDSASPRTPTGYVPVYHRFTFDTPHKGALKYDKPLDTDPNNFAPFWCCYMWTADASTDSPVPKVQQRTEMYFTG